MNAVAELKQPGHAANRIAVAFKDARRAWFRALLVRLDVDDPDGLATQLMLLVDGAIAAAIVRGDPKVAHAARAAAATLLAAAGVDVDGAERRRRSSPRKRGSRARIASLASRFRGNERKVCE